VPRPGLLVSCLAAGDSDAPSAILLGNIDARCAKAPLFFAFGTAKRKRTIDWREDFGYVARSSPPYVSRVQLFQTPARLEVQSARFSRICQG